MKKRQGKTRVQIITPQFERETGTPPPAAAHTIDFARLREMSIEALESLGMRVWHREHGRVVLLFPHEWYARIPEGYEIVTVAGRTKRFARGVTDDDIRFGMLSYGIEVHE